MEKGSVSIFYCKYENKEKLFEDLKGLPSVLNALFKILITSDDEPILISGPSSFKTYLAKLLFIHGKSEVISLNSESTISQLIGSSTLLTSEKSKNYYLQQIYEILQVNNIENFLKDLDDFDKNKEKITKNIEENIKEKKIDKKHTFYYALENFKKKLFQDDNNKKSLFDMKIEFKPGIFISARIKGYNLILKNITYVKTENLERLNEALTGNKKITLNEDTQNSFTPEHNKEISFSNDFRVIGTCNEGEETSLSDAFLSRFTLIYVDKYKDEEELKVLKDIATDIRDIELLNQILENYYSKFNDINRMNLSQKINCFNITKEVDKIRKNNSHQDNLKLVAYYLLKGLNEKREEKINEINKIFNINNYYDDCVIKYPIEIIKNSKSSFIKSKLNDLIMNINPEKIKEKKNKENTKNKDEDKKSLSTLIFTNKIKEVIDAIHFSLSSKTPLILEGEYGQGKLSAIEYYASQAKLELVQVLISKSTKVDDLLCKTTFKKNEKGNFSLVNSKTPLCHAIEWEDDFPNKLVVLEGINNATPAVLEVLNSIYGPKGTNILLSNGSTIKKGNMNLISIFNPSDDFTREKLPGNLINNSLYYIVEDPSKNDIVNIISNLFNKAELPKTEKDEFTISFLKAQKIAKEGVGEFPITLHEVRKYISFRKSIPNLDKTIFLTFIFNYHFTQKENIYRAQKELKLDTFLFNPIINYDGSKKYLTFKSSKKGKSNQLKIEIKYPDKIKSKKLIKKFNSMTLTEKLCFLFLLCCVIARKTPIIQGITASGKSFIIKVFSEILGQDLSVYQLNSNSGLSLFTGQSVMKEEFDDNEKSKLKKILKLLKIDKTIEEINSEDFTQFQIEINKKLKSNKLSEMEKKEYEKAKNTLTILKSPLNRFKHEDSELIKAIKTGKYIALDGIEMASPQISEKLSTLCGEVPTLNVFESGLEDSNFDSSNINPNFRLFIVYNPSSQNSKKIDRSLFNKCIKFTLPSIDSSPRDATTMLYESIVNNSTIEDSTLWVNLCARIAKYHIEETKKSKENTELVAGNVPFTSRNLVFISNDFHHSLENNEYNISIESWLQSVFDNYYWRSFINYSSKEKNKFKENTLKTIKAVPDQQYKVDQELDFNEEFKEIVEDLIAIQKYAAKNVEYREFLFSHFLDKCLLVPINKEKMQSMFYNLEDTILLLDNNIDIDEIFKNKFYQINFIKNNYENILNHFDNVSGFEDKLELINDQLLKNEDIKLYILRMRFLSKILKNNDSKNIYEQNLNYKLFTPYSNELSKKLLDLIKNKNKNSFEELIIFLFENPDTFKIIDSYYPYNNIELKEKELKFANYYIYLWSHLYMKKYNFSVRINNNRYDIQFPEVDQDKRITTYFILNEKNSLILSQNSFIKLNIKNQNDNYNYKYIYIEIKDQIEEKTKEMIKWTMDNYNSLFKESPLKTFEEIDEMQFESNNFFTNSIYTLISRIWSLIINLADKFMDVLEYFKKAFCFLERDVIEIFEYLYNTLEINLIDNLIKDMSIVSFFCDSDSVLWKYRNLINIFQEKKKDNVQEEEKEEEKEEKEKEKVKEEEKDNYDINYFYNYFRIKQIDVDEELLLIKKEIKNIDKLIIYWQENKCDNYKSKLLTLQNILITYKNKDIEDAEITKLRNEANSLLRKLDSKTKNNTSNIKSLNFLKDEISKFTNSERPTKELFQILENKVNVFINLISQKNVNNLDIIYLPNKTNIDINIDLKKYKLYEFLFWYSFIDDGLNTLLDSETNERTFMEISLNLYKDIDLDPIITFINEIKLELSGKEEKLSFLHKQQIKQMLRGILLSKIRSNNIELKELYNFVNEMNSKINQNDEIEDEEYYFTYMISDKYSKNLKIIMPFFEPLDIFYLFYKYDKGNQYKLGELFNGTKCNFGGINDIPKEILKKTDYNNMVEVSEKIAILFYQNITGQQYKNEENIALLEFLKKESDREKSNDKKELLKRIITCLLFIVELQEIIYKKQKENSSNFEFKLDDFNKLLNKDKNNVQKLMSCSNIFKKQKEFIEKDDKELILYSPSFIYYINNNQSFINELFSSINNSDISIVYDINKGNKINYLPFWIYILRNLSSLNCLEYGKKDFDKKISNDIIDKIKRKISYCLNNKKPLTLQWLNLVLENVSSEILDQNIHLFYNFFNSLINNLNISGKNLKIFAINELKNYFCEIIDSVFDKKLNKLLDCDLFEEKDNNILKFTNDPSLCLYDRIKKDINDKFIKIMENENIYSLLEDFINKINKLGQKFEEEIIKTNNKLFEIEFEKLKIIHSEEINKKFKELIKSNSNNFTYIDKILAKKDLEEITNKQISEEDIKNLENYQEDIVTYEKYGLKKKEDDNLICFKISYDFTKIKDRQYNLLYKDKIVEIYHDINKGYIYMINNENNEDFMNNFKIEIKKVEKEEDDKLKDDKEDDKSKDDKEDDKSKDDKEDDKSKDVKKDDKSKDDKLIDDKLIDDKLIDDKLIDDKLIDYKLIDGKLIDDKLIDGKLIDDKLIDDKLIDDKEDDKLIDDKLIDRKVEDENVEKEKEEKNEEYKVNDFINFSEAKKIVFYKYEIENEEEIKKSIENTMRIPNKKDVKNPPEILLNGYKEKYFFETVESFKKSSNNLFNLFKDIIDKQISEKALIDKFEKEIKNLINYIEETEKMLKLNINDYDDLNNISKDFGKEIKDFLSNIRKYYKNYKGGMKDFLTEFFNIEEKKVFSLDFSLPHIPTNPTDSYIHLNKMNKNAENLCVPIINIDSEGKNLICCYKTLELDLGKTCPAFYNKPYIINIISFVNEDMTVKVKSYKENKIEEKDKNKEKEENEKEVKEEGENEEEKKMKKKKMKKKRKKNKK